MEPMSNFMAKFDLVDSTFDQLAMTAIMIVIWTMLFLLVNTLVTLSKMRVKQANDTRNRIVSIVHGLLTLLMSVYIIFLSGETFDVESPNTQLKNLTVIVSLSYVIYDLVACYHYDLFDAGLLIHHVLCIIGYGSALTSDYGSIVSIGGIYYAEVSNLPMHLRMIVKNAGLRYSLAYELFENLYLGIYIPSRGFFCPLNLLYPSLMADKCPWGVKLVCFAILLQSAYYIVTMFGMIKKKLSNYKQMQQKHIKYNWLSIADDLDKLSYFRKEEKRSIF